MRLPKLFKGRTIYFIRTDGLTFARTLCTDVIHYTFNNSDNTKIVATKNYEAWLYEEGYREFWDVYKNRLLKKWEEKGEHVFVP